MSNRAETLKRIMDESQRHYAAYVLFNQALADHLRIHSTDLQCVALLDLESGPVSTGEIARLTGLTPGSATRLVDRLEKAGLVTRVPSATDRRSVLVRLTGRGREIIDEAVAAGLAEQTRLLSHMAPDRVRQLATLLREALNDRA